MIKKAFYILTIVLISTTVFGQFHKKKNRPLVELDGTYKMHHFYISPGLTFMLPNEMERLAAAVGNNASDVRL